MWRAQSAFILYSCLLVDRKPHCSKEVSISANFLSLLPTQVNYLQVQNHEQAVLQHSRRSTTWETNIPYGYQFVSQLLHFQSNVLLTHLGKQQKMAQVFRLLHLLGRPRRSSWFLATGQPSSDHCSHAASGSADGRFSSFFKYHVQWEVMGIWHSSYSTA